MTVRPVRFEDVFDGKSNYNAALIVRASLVDVAYRLGATIVEGEDGLDRFCAVPLVLDNPDGQLKFALWRHDGNPQGTFSIHTASDAHFAYLSLAIVLEALNIQSDAIIWRAEAATPQDDGSQAAARLTA